MIRILALPATLTLALFALPAFAGVEAVLDDHILPQVERFTEATDALADARCEPAALRPAFAEAAQTLAGISHLTLGPVEEAGRGRTILFCTQSRDATGRSLRLLIAQGEKAWTPEAIARASVAARGLGALERLIYERGVEPCALTRALSRDLAATARTIRDGWRDGFAERLRTAGQPGNTRFLSPGEAQAALFTALTTGLEYLREQRLGEPLGTFEDPGPLRAELRRSGQSMLMVRASLDALHQFAGALGEAPETQRSLARATGPGRPTTTRWLPSQTPPRACGSGRCGRTCAQPSTTRGRSWGNRSA